MQPSSAFPFSEHAPAFRASASAAPREEASAHAERTAPEGLSQGIQNALDWLSAHQRGDGYWNGMLESNCCMEAQWVLGMHYLGLMDDRKMDGIIRGILNHQRKDGSWEVYYDAPLGDINTTIECYAALRAYGMKADDEPVRRAREWILSHGGLRKARVFTRYWLALIGEWPWETLPVLPPELIHIPNGWPFNIYKFAAWARATIVPLCIVSVHRPVNRLAPERRLDELFPAGREAFDYSLPKVKTGPWAEFFRAADKLLGLYHNAPFHPFRFNARKRCIEWIAQHQDADGAWGGIQPPWIYGIIALTLEGYPVTHPITHAALDAWNRHWSYERNGGIHLQASESPVWDTVLAMLAALDCGETFETFPAFGPALERVLKEQIDILGDWAQLVKGVPCGGWAFQSQNDMYPDVDDTAVALIVLARIRKFAPEKYHAGIDSAIARAVKWIEAMQCKNGGWAAFDRDNTSAILTKIPFCDFGEVLDPPSSDVTAHVLEAFGLLGMTLKNSESVRRGMAFILREQEFDGSWFGRWGVNYIYGCGAAVPGLAAAGFDMTDERIARAAKFITDHQNADGGWGESCGSYMDDALRGVGPSTASQTGWALMALLATGSHAHDGAIRRGLEWLLRTQTADKTWEEKEYTGTGFPGYGLGERINLKGDTSALAQGRELARGFMINYNLYRHYFPLMAMGRARDHLAGRKPKH